MSGRSTFVPVDVATAVDLRAGGPVGVLAGCTASPGLLAWLGTGTGPDEADFAALSHAGVLALCRSALPRLVLAADARDDQLAGLEDPYGEVTVQNLLWEQVTAVFADEPVAAGDVAAAAAAVAGRQLAEALEEPRVVALLETTDLLWFAPEELDGLTGV